MYIIEGGGEVEVMVDSIDKNMPAWYPPRLDPWQVSLKYSNLATKLPSDSVAQLVRVWQAICQVAGSSPS